VRVRPIIHVVDDDSTARWLIEEMLQGIGAEIRAHADATAFLAAYRPCECEVLITDLRMPDISGLELQRRLLDQGATLPIIFVSAYSEIAAAVTAVKRGAVDFLEKPVHAGELREKVQAALVACRQLHAQSRERTMRDARLALLTVREREIAALVANGRSSREVAEQFSLSVRTVENHRSRIMEKLRVRSAVELARALD
jgi:two-component system response regulator FixJ